jgi:CrcB protein
MPLTLALYLWVALGSALGGAARFFCTGVAARLFGETFPWGTLFVNVLGSFIIGFFATLTGPDGRMFAGTTTRQFVMTGILGGFTTFSSFSLQTLNLANDGEWLQAGGNVVGSVVLCLVAVWLGHLLALSINAMKWVGPCHSAETPCCCASSSVRTTKPATSRFTRRSC